MVRKLKIQKRKFLHNSSPGSCSPTIMEIALSTRNSKSPYVVSISTNVKSSTSLHSQKARSQSNPREYFIPCLQSTNLKIRNKSRKKTVSWQRVKQQRANWEKGNLLCSRVRKKNKTKIMDSPNRISEGSERNQKSLRTKSLLKIPRINSHPKTSCTQLLLQP